MGNLTGKYDPTAEAQQELGKWPTGEYLVQIVDSDVKENKSGTGEFAEIVYEAIDGPMKGRKLWANLTLTHTNNTAQEIGQRQMASLREATGVTNPNDTQDFHYKPHVIRVEYYEIGSVYAYGKKKGQKREFEENEIKAWKKAEGFAGGQGNAPAAAAASPQTTAPSDAAPWLKKQAA